MPHFIRYWLPLIVYGLLIFVQSSFPSPVETPDVPFFDKILHIGAYAVMGALFCRAYAAGPLGTKIPRLAALSILSAVLYGISDELHQYFVPGRDADVLDAAADLFGASCGVALWLCFAAKRAGRRSTITGLTK